MKINIPESAMRRKTPRPTQPAVSLSDEAYDALLTLSDKHRISMRKLASMLIMESVKNLEVIVDDENSDHV